MIDELPSQPRKGRGAVSNPTGRFEPTTRVLIDDGWDHSDADDPDWAPPPLRTKLHVDTAKTIITRNASPDVPFDRSINPYRGCEHGCVYCFARPTHAFLGLSPGLDFESQLYYKPDAAALLDKELRHPRYDCRVIAMGTNTDPYQPVERRLGVMRDILKTLSAFNHPVGIVTKSALVLRDLDILKPMAERGLAQVCVSVTTLDGSLARRLEPRAAAPWRRLETIETLAEAGVPTGVMFAPVIPALNDAEMEAVLDAAAARGASLAGYVMLRLPLEIKDLFAEWLEAHAPNRAGHVMNMVRSIRGGMTYDSRFGKRMRGTGAYAELIGRRFHLASKRLGLDRERHRLDTTQFKPPPALGDQLSLL